MMPHLLTLLHGAAALLVALALAAVGRRAAVRLRQPDVIGEIGVGLLAGPLLLAVLGRSAFDAVLPADVVRGLTVIGQGALALYLVGLAHHLRGRAERPGKATVGWVAAGSLIPAMLTGALLAWGVIAFGDQAVRGAAPAPAFVLMTAVSMSISAVPVMARILTFRRMQDSPSGTLTMAAAVVIDSVGWLLLTLAICLNARTVSNLVGCLTALAVGVVLMLVLRAALRSRTARLLVVGRKRTMTVFLAVAACSMGYAMEHLGMTAILGAAMVGFAVPGGAGTPWNAAVAGVSRAGRFVVPVFFVVTGVNVLSSAYGSVSWYLLLATVVLGVAGKTLGGYAGARLAGRPPAVAREVGVLMNTRGLTELIVLQAGVSAGILTGPMTLALVVMALATTAMTGPMLSLLERKAPPPVPEPARTPVAAV
ncbi:cation:proton antiporter [Streptomyces sp. NPDC088746]|uniref:cation:proton antiporter n=1 Tax=Streptomyces sp. NPDC088746 TaxID=3365885 RepID=UPI003806AE78